MQRLIAIALSLLLFTSIASAQTTKKIYDPVLEGGRIVVERTLDVTFIGPTRRDPTPEYLSTGWVTLVRGVPRRVLVTEERLPGQSLSSWQVEHRRLVVKAVTQFPPIGR